MIIKLQIAVSHRYLFDSLTKSGIPVWIVNIIESCYSKLSVAVIKMEQYYISFL